MSTEHRMRLLRQIAHSPKMAHDFTHGDVMQLLGPGHVERLLADMVEDGQIVLIGAKYHATANGHMVLNRPTTMAEPRTWCGASTVGQRYTPPKWNVRAGSDVFLKIQSRGIG